MGGLTSTTIESADVDEAEALLRRGGAPSTIRPACDGHPGFGFDAAVQSDGELTVARYRLSGAWTLRAQPDRHAVTTADSDALRWEEGSERGRLSGAPSHFAPGANAVHLDGVAEVFEFQFTPPALQRLAAEAYGVEQVRLLEGPVALREAARVEYWPAVMRYTRTLFDGGLLQDEHLRAALKTNLAVTMLSTFSMVGATREWRLTPVSALAAYRRAVAFIESAAMRPIGALDVARAVGLPLRLLDEHFRTQTGDSIAGALRRARLSGAHAQLMRAEPSRAVAEQVVARWGFGTLEAFLPLHRRAYAARPLPFEG